MRMLFLGSVHKLLVHLKKKQTAKKNNFFKNDLNINSKVHYLLLS